MEDFFINYFLSILQSTKSQFRLILIKISKIHRNQFTYPGLLHGNTINYIYSTHGGFVVRYNNELGVLAELPDHVGELSHVGIIQRRIHLIQDTERGWFNQVDRKQ